MQTDLPLEGLKQARRTDARLVADITGEAFSQDPVNQWVFGTERGILSCFRILSPLYLESGLCYLADDKGAAQWLGPNAEIKFSLLPQLKFMVSTSRYSKSGAMKRALSMSEKMQEAHPKVPHYYLFTISALASARGQGIGRRLISPMLAHADREGVPVYLENSNPVNHGFYVSHGFEKIGEFEVGPGGPPMAPMWREPRAA